MPMITFSALVSALFSLAVLTALATGICYLIIVSVRRTRLLEAALSPSRPSVAPPVDKCCARCGRRLSLLSLGHSRRLHCAHCRLPVCRHCCARTSNTRWLCVSCRKLRDVRLQSGEWFYQQLRQRFRSTVAALGDTDKKDGEVQEFVERLVESLVGGGLDDVSLYPLSDRPEYTVTQDGETASDLHSELKDLMKQIIQEAMSQPQFMEGDTSANWPPTCDDSPDSLGQRSYEDILATAILNKVFAKYQQTRARRKQKSKERTFDKNSNLLSEKSPGKMERDSSRSDSGDSDAPSNSLDSWSESSHHEPLSVTIEEYIEEVTTRYSSDEDDEQKTDMDKFLSNLKYIKRQRAPFPELGKDIVDGGVSSSDEGEEDRLGEGVELVNPVDSWEENWLFQRRRLKTSVGTCQPVPVPMLVPHPHTDQRAMIGDLDADEMSDLSDCSDSVLQDLIDPPDEKESIESLPEESVNKNGEEVLDKHREIFLQYISEDLNKLIKPDEDNRGLSPDTGQGETLEDPQQIQVSPTTNQSPGSTEETDSSNSYSIVEARNLTVPVVQVDSGEGSLDMQQDSEYTVAYASVAQVRPGSQDPSPCPTPSPVPKPRTVLQKTEINEVLDENVGEDQNSLTELSIPPRPGTLAEREHSKWEKAPPLANNPYSKENIARRQRQRMYLSRHSSSENSIEFPELTGTKEPSLMEIDSRHRRDDCNKYVRDYYVNKAEGREGLRSSLPPRSSSAEPRPSSQVNNCSPQQQVSVRVEVEVAISKASPQSGVPTVTQANALHQVTTVVAPVDDSYISLPSVKELAKQFSTPDEKIPTPSSPVTVRKQTETKLHSPIRQVHSLTARNISREFRENLRGKSPAIAVVTVSREREQDSSGHVSEDSGTVSPTPCPHPPPRRLKLQNDIQFWEQLKDQR